jgi:hypothetical protein
MDLIVRKVETQAELEAVYRLTHDAYVAEGYAKPQPDGMLRHYERYDRLEETDIFIAVDNGEIIGTNTLTASNLTGFPMDEDFPDEVDQIRHRSFIMGRYLGASWRIATAPECRKGLAVILALIKATVERCAELGINEMIYVFNPKHVPIYKRLLGMSTVTQKHIEAVGAPGVLMYSDGRHLCYKWLDICEKRGIPKTVAIRDFWWPTAKASRRNILQVVWQDVPAILGALCCYPILGTFLLYDKLFPVKP